MKRIQIIVLFLMSGFFFWGCIEYPFSKDYGSLLINGSLISENSKLPILSPDLQIKQYVLDFKTHNDVVTKKENVILEDGDSEIILSVGSWDLFIYAEDSIGMILAKTFLEGVEIEKDNVKQVEAILFPVSGRGGISITLDYSAKPDDVTIKSVEYSLFKGIASPVEIDSGELVAPYIINVDCNSGIDYKLVFEIITDSDTIISEWILHVYTGVTTVGTVVIKAEEFIYLDIGPPPVIERLVFIHHSCGSNWLRTGNGNLGDILGRNNYHVCDTSYGWEYYNGEEMEDVGSYTDTKDWLIWFGDPDNLITQNNNELRRDNIMESLYATNVKNATYIPITDPGGENDIIMFKSCYPLSEVGETIDDEKNIYIKILEYFKLRQDKLFILVTPPGETVVSSYEKTKELCEWLVDEDSGWLALYEYNNVGVFDFYCVLSETDSQHTIVNNEISYNYAVDYDGISPYHDGDNHPNSLGNQKSTDEFILLLNYYYNKWKND